MLWKKNNKERLQIQHHLSCNFLRPNATKTRAPEWPLYNFAPNLMKFLIWYSSICSIWFYVSICSPRLLIGISFDADPYYLLCDSVKVWY